MHRFDRIIDLKTKKILSIVQLYHRRICKQREQRLPAAVFETSFILQMYLAFNFAKPVWPAYVVATSRGVQQVITAHEKEGARARAWTINDTSLSQSATIPLSFGEIRPDRVRARGKSGRPHCDLSARSLSIGGIVRTCTCHHGDATALRPVQNGRPCLDRVAR